LYQSLQKGHESAGTEKKGGGQGVLQRDCSNQQGVLQRDCSNQEGQCPMSASTFLRCDETAGSIERHERGKDEVWSNPEMKSETAA